MLADRFLADAVKIDMIKHMYRYRPPTITAEDLQVNLTSHTYSSLLTSNRSCNIQELGRHNEFRELIIDISIDACDFDSPSWTEGIPTTILIDINYRHRQLRDDVMAPAEWDGFSEEFQINCPRGLAIAKEESFYYGQLQLQLKSAEKASK